MCQRDQTRNLTEFEQCAFRKTRAIFLNILHLSLTLDDYLFGTRAADNHVKTLNCWKADKENHSADVVADAIFIIILKIRFRRRGERKTDLV